MLETFIMNSSGDVVKLLETIVDREVFMHVIPSCT